jgi:hypothetical protein
MINKRTIFLAAKENQPTLEEDIRDYFCMFLYMAGVRNDLAIAEAEGF